jgi:hypothetical protein
MLAVFLGWGPWTTRFKYQFQILLIPLLLLQHPNIPRGEPVLVDLVVPHLLYSEAIIPLLR